MTQDRPGKPGGNEPGRAATPEGETNGRASVPDHEAGEDETSAREYDETARGPGRSERPTRPAVPSSPSSAPRSKRVTESETARSAQQGITDAAARVDEDVEPAQPDDAAAEMAEEIHGCRSLSIINCKARMKRFCR